MIILHYLAAVFAGLFLCNCIPHLASGLRGEPFPTPFARPRGIGHSSALVNFLWGLVNMIAGLLLLPWGMVRIELTAGFILFLAGFAMMGIYTSRHFEAVRLGKKSKP
jgi:hypothetical protein